MTPANYIQTAIANLQALLTHVEEFNTQQYEYLFDAAYAQLERAKQLMTKCNDTPDLFSK